MDVFDRVGVGIQFERRTCTIDGKEFEYFEATDAVIGFKREFEDGENFVMLSGRYTGMIYNVRQSRDIHVCDLKTLGELAQSNGNIVNINKFRNAYLDKYSGLYFTTTDYHNFYRVKDEEVIDKIKRNRREYDDDLLNNQADISQMYAAVKKTIISQDEQIMQILTSLFKNQSVIDSGLDADIVSKLKENIIIYGSTGTGKTEILKRIAKIYGAPIVIEDSTSLSETGYVGRDITSMLKNLYLAAGKDIEKAQTGILVLDEFDKLAEKPGTAVQDHVSRKGVQRSLLKLLDGSVFYFDGIEFDTSRLSIVALGAFEGIAKDDDYSSIESTDFVDYGIMRELMGRFSKMIPMNPLSKEDIKKILVESDFSPLNTYKLFFQKNGIEFSYDESFVDFVADTAIELKSGARSLKKVVDSAVSGALFRIFAGEYEKITLTGPDSTGKAYTLMPKNINS